MDRRTSAQFSELAQFSGRAGLADDEPLVRGLLDSLSRAINAKAPNIAEQQVSTAEARVQAVVGHWHAPMAAQRGRAGGSPPPPLRVGFDCGVRLF